MFCPSDCFIGLVSVMQPVARLLLQVVVKIIDITSIKEAYVVREAPILARLSPQHRAPE